MSLNIITVGDKTDHGGTVISGSPDHDINGRSIARLGDKVACPLLYRGGKPHGINNIITAHEAPNGATYEERALPPGTDKLASYHRYEVTKPVVVESGPATPWFDEVGMGTQYKTEKSVEEQLHYVV